MQQRQTDVVIIGAGTAGMTAYRAVIRAGKQAILVESGVFGTTCARVGCMPSKLLIAAADAAYGARHTALFGVHVDGVVRVDGVEVMHRVRTERDRFVGFVVDDINHFPDTDKVLGHASFINDHTVQVGDHTQITATSFVVATGSSPFSPHVLHAAGDRLITNDDVFYWQDLPKSIVVIGAGVIALELGQALHRLGVKTTLLSRSENIGGITDPVVLKNAKDTFTHELDLQLNTSITATERMGDQVTVYFEQNGQAKQVTADFVLSAAGRIPNVKGLGLENTSAQCNDKGMPKFDRATLLIENTSIFFAGDVNQLHPILHEAADDGYQSGVNAAQWPASPIPVARRAAMGVVFTSPQIIKVGASWRDLNPEAIQVGEVSFANQGRSRVMLKNQGCLRVYATKETRQFLGAEMIGPSAEHLAHLLAWSLQMKLTIDQMLTMPFYHPVIEEGLRTALRNTH